MHEALRILIIHEETGFSAGCLEDENFLLLGDSVTSIKERLEGALQAHFGEPVAYWIISEPRDRAH